MKKEKAVVARVVYQGMTWFVDLQLHCMYGRMAGKKQRHQNGGVARFLVVYLQERRS